MSANDVEALTSLVESLRNEVHDLRDRLERYEAADHPDSSARADAQAARALAETTRAEIAALQDDAQSGYGEGLEISYWGWLTYLYRHEAERSTFWAWELELNLTKTFNERLAAGADVDVIDQDDGAQVNLEQLFLSALLSMEHETVLTVGKFNAPFGIEARDFWDQKTGSRSLLWDALPHDLTGVLFTQPLGTTGFLVQGLVVNGFDQNLDVNQQPSFGVVGAWSPDQSVRVAATYFGGPEVVGEVGEKQHLALLEATLTLSPRATLDAECLYGTSDLDPGSAQWWGAAGILTVDLDDRWRAFARYSYLDDGDGFITGVQQEQHEVGVGFSLQLDALVEVRAEYRHDFRSVLEDDDSLFAHVTFGF